MLLSNSLFFAPDGLAHSQEITIIGRSLDAILSKGPIGARATVSGWTAWVCPLKAVNCNEVFFRFKIREAVGHTEIVSIFNEREEVPENLLKGGAMTRTLAPDGTPLKEDLSGSSLAWPSVCQRE